VSAPVRSGLSGVWAAVLTPLTADYSPDAARAVRCYRDLLERGCDGINVLGTTGEAMSLGVDQREVFMEAIAASGLPMERVMVGTGAASLRDASRLTRRAFEAGFAAALVMPPFFYRDASDDGIVAFFDELFGRTDPPRGSVMLYNFPRMSGITFHRALTGRLLEEFPDTIAGMKDSSNDCELQREILSWRPDQRIFPGSETDLLAAGRRGAAGCISGSVALWPELAHAVFTDGDDEKDRELSQRRAALDGLPFIPAVRYVTAVASGEPEWERALPPLQPLTPGQRRTLRQRVGC
jgi:4-hydroxy-tetrahydrodipicolinate synthase